MLFGIDLSQLLRLDFWLDAYPGTLSPRFELIFLIILIVNYGLFFLIKQRSNSYNKKKSFILGKFFGRVANLFLTLAVTFTFIFFFRYEGIPILGGRFWMLFWVLGGLGWGIYLIHRFRTDIPEMIAEANARRRFENYLPKRRAKKKKKR